MHRHCASPLVAHENGSYTRRCLVLLLQGLAARRFTIMGGEHRDFCVQQDLCTAQQRDHWQATERSCRDTQSHTSTGRFARSSGRPAILRSFHFIILGYAILRLIKAHPVRLQVPAISSAGRLAQYRFAGVFQLSGAPDEMKSYQRRVDKQSCISMTWSVWFRHQGISQGRSCFGVHTELGMHDIMSLSR